MPNRSPRVSNESTNTIPPDRHHGGRELPDDVQDRPEQNAGYDAAVRGDDEPAAQPLVDEEDLDLTDVDRELDGDEELPH